MFENIFGKTCVVCGYHKSADQFREGSGNTCKKCLSARANEWNKNNRERVQFNKRKYNKSLKGKIQSLRNSQVERTGKPLDPVLDNLTEKDLDWMLKDQEYRCWGNCGGTPLVDEEGNFQFEFDHGISVSNGGHLSVNGGQLLCPECNAKKHDKNIWYMRANFDSSIKGDFNLSQK